MCDFYCEFNFRILLVCFCLLLLLLLFLVCFFCFFHFHGIFSLKLFMCINYSPFFRHFVIITFAALSGKLPLFVKSRLCVFILPHSLILLVFVLSLILSCKAKLPTKTVTPRYSSLLSELNQSICVTIDNSSFYFNSYPPAN